VCSSDLDAVNNDKVADWTQKYGPSPAPSKSAK